MDKGLLNIFYTNADSFLNKRQELLLFLNSSDYKPKVIAITEVKPKRKENFNYAELNLDGYDLYTNEFENITFRGVLLYVDKTLAAKQVFLNCSFQEYVIVKIQGENEQLLICNVYRSPSSGADNNTQLFNFINCLSTLASDKLLLLGDFNFRDINWDNGSAINSLSNDFIEVLRDNFLIQNITIPTRARGSDTPHILDLVISNDNFITDIDYCAPLGKSDHASLVIKCIWQSNNIDNSVRYNFNKGDYEAFRNYVNIDWVSVFEDCINNVEKMWNKFKNILLNGNTLFVPTVCKFSTWKRKKWVRPIDNNIKTNIKLKKKSWKKFIRTKDIVDYNKYKAIRNEVRYNTRQLYKDEQNKIAKECKSNPKKFWNYINSKTKSHNKIEELYSINDNGVETVVSNDLDKANVLSNYFSSVFNTDSCEELPPCDVTCSTEMDNITIDVEDIKKRLNNLNVYKSYGPDMLHPRILKELKNEIALPLKLIFECSLATKLLPEDWKLGNITPIFKKGKKSCVNNYRPVSLTCVLCKLLESIIRDHIIEHLTSNKLFSEKQFGFIKGRSTVTQLLEILDKWTDWLESGGQIDVIYTDLEKAFDKVPHKLLIHKLKAYNLNSQVIDWIISFLSNRQQRVRLFNTYSNWVQVISGIPQGSILGPLLFLIYVNDIQETCRLGSNLYLYADDSKLFRYISGEFESFALQSDLTNLKDWFTKWLLKLNIDKCKVVSFGRNVINVHQYCIEDVEIEHVQHIKDLGVTFEAKLNFSLHINDKVNKANSILGIIKRNFRYLSQESFVMLYKSLVRSHLEYANVVWCPYKKGDISLLERVQRRATKLISSIKHLPYEDRLKKLKLPSLKYRRARGDMIEVFKILNGYYDNIDNISLAPNVSVATRGNKYKLYQSYVKYDLRKHFFTNRVVSLWNSLPNNVVDSDSINCFKNRLDKFWSKQDVVFNWEADFTGTGNRSYVD